MPHIVSKSWANRRRFAVSGLLAMVGLALVLILPGVGSAWTLNGVQLDDGTCGHNLQLGSDLTASSSATPWFLLFGDGSRASYQVSIDGTSIGTFNSNSLANVCISDTVHLSEGPHTLTAQELAPNTANAVAPFAFSVDTVAPTSPSTPVMASFSDSGVLGDNTTMFANPSLSGTAQPGVSILYFDNGSAGFGGTFANSSGQWSAKTINLANGVHSITALAQDEAGNQSAPSPALQLTIDSTHPAVSFTNPAANATVSGTVNLTASASDNLAVWKVALQVDGTTLVTDTASPYSYGWNSASVADGTHTLTATATDTAGNTTTTTETITVQNSGSATAPTAPTLTSASASNGSVALSWSAPTSNGGSAITGYKVYRGTTSGSETLLTTLGNVTSFTDTGLTNGTTYYYKVSALNAVGESVASNEMSAMPVTTPGSPTLTSAVPGNSVTLTWSAPANTGGSAVTGYKVYRGTASGGETLLATVGNVTTYTDGTTTYGTTYYFQVSAVTSVGEGSKSNEMSATPMVAPGAPTLSSASAGNTSVALAWSAPSSNGGSAITGYKVYRGTASGGETLLATLGNVTSWTDSTVSNGSTYFYTVSAVNSVGEGTASNEMSASPSAVVPSAPTLNSATAGNGSVALGWSAPSSNGGSAITGYKVYRGTTSGGETLLTTLGNVTSWTDSGVTNGSTYFYKVSALNSAGEGAASGEKSASPFAVAPSAPTLNSATAGTSSVALAWSAPSSNGGSAITGYKVYRGTTSGSETLLATLGNVTSWTDSSVTNGTPYFYKVSALNSAGESAASNEQSATPFAVAPSAPTLNSATAGNSSVALGWSAPSSNGGASVTGYKVYRGTTSGGETLLTTLGNVTGWTDSSVANGTAYFYKVSAVNSAGESVVSNEKSATPFAVAPTAPTLNSATAGTSSVALAWSAPSSNGGSAITGYKVYRGTTSGSETLLTTLGNVTSWNDSGVTNGTTYFYKVSALNSAGESAASNEQSAMPSAPATAPSAPTLNAATTGNSTVALAWSVPSSNGGSAITGYKVYRGTTSGGEILRATLGNVTSWTDNASNGTAYYYEVSAVNAVGESIASNELSATPATVPGAPTLNTAAAGNGSVALGWSAPASNGGSTVTGYKVYRGTSSGLESLLASPGNVTSWTDSSAANGTTYYYKVTAVNALGESVGSNELSATPTAPLTVPGAPALNSATAGNSSVALGWSAPGSNGGSAITGYKVYRGTASGGEALLTTLGNVTSWTDNSATNGTTYYYEVAAVNSVGESVGSNELSATPATAPGAPTLNSANAGNGSIALGWSAPSSNGGAGVTGYKVYRGTTSGGETLLTTLGNVTSWTDSGASNGTTYFYKVTALNSAGESTTSNELSATPATSPSAPTLNSATAGNGTVALAWSAPASNGGATVTAYKVYRSTTSGNETLLTTLGNVTSWTDSGAANGATYYYKVSAVNSVGEGLASNERSATPAATTAPGAPTLSSVSANRHGFALTWAAPTSNGGSAITGYRIYRGTATGAETLLATVGNVTTWTDTSASSGTYFYEVTAVNAVGESARSNELSTAGTRKGHK